MKKKIYVIFAAAFIIVFAFSFNLRAQCKSQGKVYIIKSGDTLWDIAGNCYGDPTLCGKLAKINGCSNPRNVPVGTEIEIPANASLLEALATEKEKSDEAAEAAAVTLLLNVPYIRDNRKVEEMIDTTATCEAYNLKLSVSVPCCKKRPEVSPPSCGNSFFSTPSYGTLVSGSEGFGSSLEPSYGTLVSGSEGFGSSSEPSYGTLVSGSEGFGSSSEPSYGTLVSGSEEPIGRMPQSEGTISWTTVPSDDSIGSGPTMKDTQISPSNPPETFASPCGYVEAAN